MSKQKEVLDEWLTRYKGLLIKVIRSFVTESEDFDDLFQEISIQLWNSIPNFKGDSADSTWVYRVALNTAIKWSKSQTKYNDHRSDVEIDDRILVYKNEEEDERIQWLYAKISQLDEVDKSLIILFLDGYSYKETAEITGISQSLVGVKIHRIKKQLTIESKKHDNDAV